MFSVKELMELAVNVEENGEKFYKKLSEKVKDDEQKNLFEYLAAQEMEHARIFKKLGEEHGAGKEVYVQTDEVDAYLKNYVDGKIFPDLDTMLGKIEKMSFEETIDYAIKLEKDTIDFYNRILKLIKDERSRGMVEGVLKEEEKHVSDLMTLKESLNG